MSVEPVPEPIADRPAVEQPDEAVQLTSYGIRVERQVRTGMHLGPVNAAYLTAKAVHGGHRFPLGRGGLVEAAACRAPSEG